jgi:biotin synthase
MKRSYYINLTEQALAENHFSKKDALEILQSPDIQLLPLLNAAYEVRRNFLGNDISLHIINNGQNGLCPEDCHYCAQAKSSTSEILEYPLKSDEEFLAEAKFAYEKGAHRYCMVFSGRGPSRRRVERLANLIRLIKKTYPLEVCVSPGLLDEEKSRVLKEAGLDRLNHNLNTSRQNYPHICSTHTFDDRLNTLRAARKAGLQICSGVILGMNETADDIVDLAIELKNLHAESIPVNMLIPLPGTSIQSTSRLTPEFCLRALCLFRLINPKSELRVAAGREIYLRKLEILAFYPANSLFIDGYLNVKGEERRLTLQMLKDAGFTIKSDYHVDELIENETNDSLKTIDKNTFKNINDLRPHRLMKQSS